ncbi:Hypothetical Protein NBC2815_03062 [Xanthomonas fragariae]|nr:Hypothetical Protein NBC2815_03062 [Xanthomonas fragariae]
MVSCDWAADAAQSRFGGMDAAGETAWMDSRSVPTPDAVPRKHPPRAPRHLPVLCGYSGHLMALARVPARDTPHIRPGVEPYAASMPHKVPRLDAHKHYSLPTNTETLSCLRVAETLQHFAHQRCARTRDHLEALTKRSEQSSGGRRGTGVYAWYMPIPSTGRARLAAAQ